MSCNPVVSVVVPVYNAKHFLERCVNSIKSQTCSQWEVIFVNDGSTDGSLEVLHSLCGEDERFRIVNKENGGASAARNVGIDEARAKYITFIDADDSVDERYVELLLDGLENYHVDLVISCIRKKTVPLLFPFSGVQRFKPFKFFKYFDGGPCGKLYKKEIIDRYGVRFPEDMKVAEDYVFFAMYALHVKSFYAIPDVLYFYYLDNSASLMHKFWLGSHDYGTYCLNIEAPWRVYKNLLKCSDIARKEREEFIYAMYRHLWVMYYASLEFVMDEQKSKLVSIFCEKHRDFEKEVGLLKRILLPQRYPRLYKFARRMRNCICHFFKRA